MPRVLKLFDVSPFLHAGHVNKYSKLEQVKMVGARGIVQTTCTGGLSLIMNSLSACNKDCDFVFCCDRNPTIKKDMYPGYKANRPHKSWMAVEKGAAEYVLEVCGGTVLSYAGYEADDIIYTLVKKCHDMYDEIHIYTGDSDLYFLVDDKVSCLPATSTGKYVTRSNWEYQLRKKGIRYCTSATEKIIHGDTSDGVTALSRNIQAQVASLLYRDGFWEKLGDRDFVRGWISVGAPDALVQCDVIFPLMIDEITTEFSALDWNLIRNFGIAINNKEYRGCVADPAFNIDAHIVELQDNRGLYLTEDSNGS